MDVWGVALRLHAVLGVLTLCVASPGRPLFGSTFFATLRCVFQLWGFVPWCRRVRPPVWLPSGSLVWRARFRFTFNGIAIEVYLGQFTWN